LKQQKATANPPRSRITAFWPREFPFERAGSDIALAFLAFCDIENEELGKIEHLRTYGFKRRQRKIRQIFPNPLNRQPVDYR
jgi:hypothetical protein